MITVLINRYNWLHFSHSLLHTKECYICYLCFSFTVTVIWFIWISGTSLMYILPFVVCWGILLCLYIVHACTCVHTHYIHKLDLSCNLCSDIETEKRSCFRALVQNQMFHCKCCWYSNNCCFNKCCFLYEIYIWNSSIDASQLWIMTFIATTIQ